MAPQLMPAGVDLTIPLPLPVFVTANVYLRAVNVAVAAFAAVIRTLHVAAVPVQAPDQPVKVIAASGLDEGRARV